MIRVGFLSNTDSEYAEIRMLAITAHYYGIDFFHFKPEQVNIETKTIRGNFLKDGIFVEKEVPYPILVDNRIYHHPIVAELSKTSLLCMHNLGGKQKVYNILQKNGYSKYLIETYPFKNQDIDQLLERHNTLIIKPDVGNQGKDIYKLSKEGDLYCLSTNKISNKLTKSQFESDYAKKFAKKYIVQNYVDSVTNQGNPFDVRICTRRGKDGAWNLITKHIRICGSADGITSNIHQGGSIGYADSFLKAQFGDERKIISKELSKISKNLPNVVQSGYDDMLDALGFDVGIDRSKDNKIKIFEVNYYPAWRPYGIEGVENRVLYYKYLFENHTRLHEIQKIKLCPALLHQGLDFVDYIQHLTNYKSNYLIIFSSKDTPGTTPDSSMSPLKLMDLQHHRLSYAAVINDGKVLYEKVSSRPEDPIDFISYENNVDGNALSVVSKGYKIGNAASIKINEIDYSINKRGLNIVVYDKINKKCVESVNFDTWDKTQKGNQYE